MSFANEKFLWLLFLLPAILFFLIYGLRRQKILSHRFVEAGLLDKLLIGVNKNRRTLKLIVVAAAIITLIFSLAQPRWGKKIARVKRRGLDIFIALDVSNSMLARDIYPSRLEKAKLEIKNLINKMGGDRVGLIAFAGNAFVVSPLTIDYAVFNFLLDDLDAGSISQGGTDLEAVINTGGKSFDTPGKADRVLVIFTDGEKNWGDPVTAAEKARAEGIRIYTVGIGTSEGAEIEITDRATGQKKTVTTKLEKKMLEDIARVGGGDWVVSNGAVVDIDRIYFDNINKLTKAELEQNKKEITIERFQIPLFFALILVATEFLLRD